MTASARPVSRSASGSCPSRCSPASGTCCWGGSSEIGGTDDDVARGIRYAADNGAKIINLSLGGPGPSGSSPVMEDAITYAVGKGVFIAIAAGNDFETGNPVEQPAEIASHVQGAVSVAAVDPASNHAHYSSSGTWVELAAPGGTDQGFSAPAYGYVWQQTFNFNYTDTFRRSRPASSSLRGSMSSPTSGTSERRWPRRTWQASRRC